MEFSQLRRGRKRYHPNHNLADINQNTIENKTIISDEAKKAKMIRKSKIENINTSGKENQTEEVTDLECYEKQIIDLQTILSAKYVNVMERLNLKVFPNCIRDMLHCKNKHSKNCPAPSSIPFNILKIMKNFISEKRTINYLTECNKMMQQGTLLNKDILNSIFQIILNNQHNVGDIYYTNDYLVNESKMVLINFINLFPPCWKAMRHIYISLCTAPIDHTKYTQYKISKNINLFVFIINNIKEIINEIEDSIQHTHNTTLDNTMSDSEGMFNFREWEMKISKKENLNTFSREEKLNRLFLCCNIFVKIFETDLSLWILRYLSTPNKHLFTKDKPLITACLSIETYNVITEDITKIIHLFLILISNNYSKMHTNIFKRLLSLLSVVMNLMDQNDNLIQYPVIKKNTIDFATKIYQIFEDTFGYCFESFIKVLENIDIPFIRLLLLDQFIKKLDKDTSKKYLTPKIIYDKISSLNWQKYKQEPSKLILNGQLQNQELSFLESSRYKYPFIENIIRVKLSVGISKICLEEYLYLYLQTLKSYSETYCTKKFLLILMGCCDFKTSTSLNKEIKRPRLTKDKIDLEKVEKTASKMLKKIDLNEHFKKSYLNENLLEYNGVNINTEFIMEYRNNIKYLSLLKKNLPKMIEKFGKEFEIFNEFIEYCFTPE